MQTLLILSRDEAIAELLTDIVTNEGYHALATHSVDDAIRYLNTAAIDLIISDLDGLVGDPGSWDRIRRVRQADGDLPLIVCATSNPEDGKVAHNVSALVTMPFDIENFLKVVGRLAQRG